MSFTSECHILIKSSDVLISSERTMRFRFLSITIPFVLRESKKLKLKIWLTGTYTQRNPMFVLSYSELTI